MAVKELGPTREAFVEDPLCARPSPGHVSGSPGAEGNVEIVGVHRCIISGPQGEIREYFLVEGGWLTTGS